MVCFWHEASGARSAMTALLSKRTTATRRFFPHADVSARSSISALRAALGPECQFAAPRPSASGGASAVPSSLPACLFHVHFEPFRSVPRSSSVHCYIGLAEERMPELESWLQKHELS